MRLVSFRGTGFHRSLRVVRVEVKRDKGIWVEPE
jgi:hypothetical protein